LLETKPVYDNLLKEFASLTKPPTYSGTKKHDVTHHIVTKRGPVKAKAKRLSPNRYKAAK